MSDISYFGQYLLMSYVTLGFEHLCCVFPQVCVCVWQTSSCSESLGDPVHPMIPPQAAPCQPVTTATARAVWVDEELASSDVMHRFEVLGIVGEGQYRHKLKYITQTIPFQPCPVSSVAEFFFGRIISLHGRKLKIAQWCLSAIGKCWKIENFYTKQNILCIYIFFLKKKIFFMVYSALYTNFLFCIK